MYEKISDLKGKTLGESTILKVLIVEAKSLQTKALASYIQLKVQDSSGILEFPVWDNYDTRIKYLVPGKVVKVSGYTNSFDGKMQIKSPDFCMLPDAEAKDCLPKYDIPESLHKYFKDTIEGLSDNYKRFAIKATGSHGDSESMWNLFMNAPAAENHHQNKIGGLFLHTVGVMKNVENMLNAYVVDPFFTDASANVNKDRMMLKAILHDIAKVWEYEWEVGIKRKNIVRDHTTMGCSYVEKINESLGNIFSEEEVDNICASILCHNGDYAKYGKAKMKTAEDYMLHLADMIDCRIVAIAEGTYKND